MLWCLLCFVLRSCSGAFFMCSQEGAGERVASIVGTRRRCARACIHVHHQALCAQGRPSSFIRTLCCYVATESQRYLYSFSIDYLESHLKVIRGITFNWLNVYFIHVTLIIQSRPRQIRTLVLISFHHSCSQEGCVRACSFHRQDTCARRGCARAGSFHHQDACARKGVQVASILCCHVATESQRYL